MAESKKSRRTVSGTVINATADKTVKVLVTRKYQHPLYKKMITERKNILHMMKRISAMLEISSTFRSVHL